MGDKNKHTKFWSEELKEKEDWDNITLIMILLGGGV
jgi:hypothetical protein